MVLIFQFIDKHKNLIYQLGQTNVILWIKKKTTKYTTHKTMTIGHITKQW